MLRVAIWVFGLALFGLAQPALAAPSPTCKAALDLPVDKADGATSTDGSEFGPHIFVIDGNSVASPQAMGAALARASGKTPLIKGGDFSGWNFATTKLPLAGLCFFESEMKGSNWDGAEGAGVGFIKTGLEGASFRNATLDRILIREANLKDTIMSGAALRDGYFDGGWGGSVENWDLTGADMRGFKFDCSITISDGCPLDRTGVKFIRTDLTDADISTYNYWGGADYSGATLNGTKLAPRQLPELVGASVNGSVLLVGGDISLSLSPAEIAELQKQNAAWATSEDQPSFACAKAATVVEKLICGEYESELRRLDRQMAELYGSIRPKNADLSTVQRDWLTLRNRCADRGCLTSMYQRHIGGMIAMLGEPEILKRGETALFIDDTVDFPAAFRETALFRKITPVLVGASMAEVVLERDADGSYSIVGESVGANAHICGVGGDALRFDPKTGWFSGPLQDKPKQRAAVFRIYGDQIEFPGDGHPDESEFPGSDSYASCGMRALLVPMNRIAVDSELLAKRRAAYDGDTR